MSMTVKYGTKKLEDYEPASGETFRDILRGITRLHRLDFPEHVTVTENNQEKRLDDIPQNNGSIVQFKSVPGRKGF